MILLAGFICVILVLLARPVQKRAQAFLHDHPRAIFVIAMLLSALFCASAAYYSAFSVPLAALIVAYTLAPTLVVYTQKPGQRATWIDFAAILLLWLPLEFAAGARLIPKAVQGILHATAYGVSITLALSLFLLFRQLPGMKYGLPRRASDLTNALIGFSIAAAVLIPVGLWIGFLAHAHAPRATGMGLAVRVAAIFIRTALPEEILFRALIQNCLQQRFGNSNRTVALAALIFGCAHLNNAPGPLPNLRYAIIATLAGFIFGKVFQKSRSIAASALVHTGVNAVKWLWF